MIHSNLRQMMEEINYIISKALHEIKQIYRNFNIDFHLKNQYLHTAIMAMVAPTEIVSRQQAISHPYVFPTVKKFRVGVSNSDQGFKKIVNLPANFFTRINKLYEEGKLEKPTQKKNSGIHPIKKSSSVRQTALTTLQQASLCQWVMSQTEKGNHMDMIRLQRKARKLARNPTFKASSFWVHTFLRKHPWIRESLYSISGAPVEESSSSDSNLR